VAVWIMKGASVGQHSVITSVRRQWTAVGGSAIFNGDGKADILWRNTSSGDVALWLMNGAAIASGTFITTLRRHGRCPESATSTAMARLTFCGGTSTEVRDVADEWTGHRE